MSIIRRKGGRWCSGTNCKNNSNRNTDISFFSFPKDEERARKWCLNSRREDLTRRDVKYLNKNCNICSVHFEDKMFANFLRNRLKLDAVPTIFSVSDPLIQKSNKRKLLRDRNNQLREVIEKAKTLQMFSQTESVTQLCDMDIKTEIKEEPLNLEGTSDEMNLFDQPNTETHNTNLECKDDVCSVSKCIPIKHEHLYSFEPFNKKQSHIVDTPFKSEIDFPIELDNKTQSHIVHTPFKSEINFPIELDNKTQPHILVTPFKSEIDFPIELDNKTVTGNSDNIVVTKYKIKEELCWLESGSSEVQPKLEQASQSEIKDVASCITGIDEDFPLIEPRGCTDEAQITSSYVPPVSVDAAVEEETSISIPENYTTNSAHQVDSSTPHQSDSINLNQIFTFSTSKKHESKKPHKCITCQKSFSFLSRLKIHNLIHSDKRSQRKTRGKKLKRHNLIHRTRKTYKCEVCDKIFKKMSHLKRHSFTHGVERPYKCELCDKTFTRESDSKAHNLMHGGESPFKCTICLKTFTRASNLKRHSLTHENKRLHKCEVCGKLFRDISHLKRHSLIHAGVKPHRCDICDKGFTQLTHLKRHNESHHKCQL